MNKKRMFQALVFGVVGSALAFYGGQYLRDYRDDIRVLVCDYAPLAPSAEIPRETTKKQRMRTAELDAAYDTAIHAGATICFNY